MKFSNTLWLLESVMHCVENRDIGMAASFLPSVMVPLVGIVFPAAAMAFLFLYIEGEEASGSN